MEPPRAGDEEGIRYRDKLFRSETKDVGLEKEEDAKEHCCG
jgi:hypothetical protein